MFAAVAAIMDPALINIFKVQFSSAYRDANAEITRRKQEKMRKTIMEPEAPAVSVEVFSRTGRPIVRPAAMRE